MAPSLEGHTAAGNSGIEIKEAPNLSVRHAMIPGSDDFVRSRMFSAWDGLSLYVREWSALPDADRPTLLCLPGLARTSADFARIGARLSTTWRVLAIDYAGRGKSGRSRDVRRYAAEACVTDVLDLAAALHLERVVALGTSFGGLLAMGIAAARPGLLRAVVLNDIGPEIGSTGQAFIRRFLAESPDLKSLDACAEHLKRVLPHLGIATEEGWREVARSTYGPTADGQWAPLWDTRIVRLLDAPVPDLWPFFGALVHVPVLLVRGAQSDILLPETVARMQREHPRLTRLELPGIGHAPTLAEPAAIAALDAFLGPLA